MTRHFKNSSDYRQRLRESRVEKCMSHALSREQTNKNKSFFFLVTALNDLMGFNWNI